MLFWYGDNVHKLLKRTLANPNALAAVSKGMRAVKLCTNKILQFLKWRCRLMQVDLYNGYKMVVVVLLSIHVVISFKPATQ